MHGTGNNTITNTMVKSSLSFQFTRVYLCGLPFLAMWFFAPLPSPSLPPLSALFVLTISSLSFSVSISLFHFPRNSPNRTKKTLPLNFSHQYQNTLFHVLPDSNIRIIPHLCTKK